jgi:trans-aconitate methyltransferase
MPSVVISDAYFDSFQTPKYRSKNPVTRALIRRFVERLHGLFVAAQPASRVLEIGVGEGFLSGYLSERFPEKSFTGLDLAEHDLVNLRQKFPRIDARQGSIYDLSGLEPPYDLVLCCEVLEHLPDVPRALDQLASLGAKHYLLTVPHEPLFMLSNLARLKNVTRLGNDPEHVNHWGVSSFRETIASRFEVVELVTSYPWLLALAKAR